MNVNELMKSLGRMPVYFGMMKPRKVVVNRDSEGVVGLAGYTLFDSEVVVHITYGPFGSLHQSVSAELDEYTWQALMTLPCPVEIDL